ncbi:hypothetical protein QUV16_23395, partial [Xanthomonas citri pv. citri]
MTTPSSISRRTQPRARIVSSLAAGVFFCGQSFAPAAHAQLVVTDPGNLGLAIKDLVEKATVYGKEAARWTQQYDHYKQQLIRIQQLQLAQSNMRDDFPERDPAYGMEDLCP